MIVHSRSNQVRKYVFLWGSLFILSVLFAVPVQGTTDFTANVTYGAPPLSVLFSDTSSLPAFEDYRQWDFGDGTVVMDPIGIITHTYTDEGSFTIKLDRIDSEGYHFVIKTAYITVVLPTPTPTTTPTTTVTTPIPTTTATTVIPTTPTTVPTTVPTTQPTVQIPSEFYGQATSSAIPVPVGSSIVAKIGERNAGEISLTTPGAYGGSGPFDSRLKVYATTDEIGAGTVLITFWLNGTVQAGQTAYFQSGSAQNLALVFGSVTPTPTTTSTTTPTTIPTTTPITTVTTVTPTSTSTTIPTTTPLTTVTTVIPTTSTTVPTVTPTGTPGFTITCEPGWNYVSIPRKLAPGADTGAIFTSIDKGGHSIWRYNSTLQLFDRVYPSTYLYPTDGIWVYSSYHTILPLYFASQQDIVERDLFKGWNGFGILSLTSVPAMDALSPVSSTWEYLYGFDAVNQTYEISIVKNGKGSHSDTRPLYPGNGYWLYMKENTTFEALIPDI